MSNFNNQSMDVDMTSIESKEAIRPETVQQSPSIVPGEFSMLPQQTQQQPQQSQQQPPQFQQQPQQQPQLQQSTPQTSQQTPQPPPITNAQKGQKLHDFIQSLEDYKPTVPDALTKYYMHTAGFDSKDPRFVRLVSILGQKFIADITNDALQHYKMRNAQTQHKKQSGKDKKYVLAYEDLAPVLAEYGIDAKKPQYFF